MITELLAYAVEIESALAGGESLTEIRKWSFEQREAGRNVPYLAVLDSGSNGDQMLYALPTKSQKELHAFFAQQAPGSVLPRFTFRVHSNGVEFMERLGRGKDNCKRVTK